MSVGIFREFMNGTHAAANGLMPMNAAALSEFVRLKKPRISAGR